MAAATAFVLTLGSGASFLIDKYLLGTDLIYLRTLSFIVVIAAIVQFTEMSSEQLIRAETALSQWKPTPKDCKPRNWW